MAKVFQDYKFCLKKEQNLEDVGSLAWFINILGLDWVSNNAQKIKVNTFLILFEIGVLVILESNHTRHFNLYILDDRN